MAPPAQRIHYHAKRGLAPHFVRRSSLLARDATVQSPTAVSATPSPSQAATIGVTLPPQGFPALIGVSVALILIVLGFAGWRIWVWSRNEGGEAATFSEKSGKPIGLFDAVDEGHEFKRPPSQSSARTIVVDYPAGPKAAFTRERSPACEIDRSYQSKVLPSVFKHNTTHRFLPPGITVTAVPPSLHPSTPPIYAAVSPPVLSPRAPASKAPNTTQTPSAKVSHSVIVDSTFTPTLSDELTIRVGEILHLVEEYEDGWCLVQRVGPKHTESGVVPRFCVVDKSDDVNSNESRYIPRI